jgi:plastocyanin
MLRTEQEEEDPLASKSIRALLAGCGLLALTAGMAPQAALGAAPPPREITVTITDKGFDKTDYTVGYSPGTNPSGGDNARVTFVNKGTTVHSATAVPGSLDEGAAFGQRVDSLGNVSACFMNLSCANTGRTDTGGIEPGGSVTLGFSPYDPVVTYTLTSSVDCLFGNSTPGFNCSPISIKVVSIAPRSGLSGTFPGSVLRPAGSSDCIPDIPPVIPTEGPAYCFSAVRAPGNVSGSPSKPLGDTTVSITDFGYDPTLVYVKAGSTVTWVNKGARVHSVQKKGPQAPPDGYHNLTSPGLGPGETYSYFFPAGSSVNYQSNTALDFVPQSMAGFAPPTGCVKGKLCGQPAMVGRVAVVG